MRILLVYAEFPRTYWGFQYSLHIVGKRASLPPLGLVTVASLLPVEWELKLVDMNVEPLEDDALCWADAVLVGGMLIQAPSMRSVVRRARALGRRTVVCGPAASTSPGEFADADVVFGGEVEGREAELVALITGSPGAGPRPAADGPQTLVALREDARPAVTSSPVPRFDLLELEAYSGMCVQYSRGCPFRCEFCDIIEIFGRRWPCCPSRASSIASARGSRSSPGRSPDWASSARTAGCSGRSWPTRSGGHRATCRGRSARRSRANT